MLTKLQIERLKIIRNLINEILDEGNMLFDEKANLEQCVNLLEWHIATPKSDEKYGYKIPFNPYTGLTYPAPNIAQAYCVTCQGPHISPLGSTHLQSRYQNMLNKGCTKCGKNLHMGLCNP